MPTNPTKCERCGQVDCPTIPTPDQNGYMIPLDHDQKTAAFQACATMGIRVELKMLREDHAPPNGPMNLVRAIGGLP